jgi:hypothetical protein
MTDPQRPGRGLLPRLGRRGLMLLLLGLAYTSIGFGFVLIPQERFSAPGAGGLLQVLDSPWFGFLWIAGGVVACASGFVRARTGHDAIGFNGLVVPAFVWSAFYTWSFLANVTTGGELGRPSAWIAAVVYAALTAIVLFLARWPDPDDPHAARVDDDTEEAP